MLILPPSVQAQANEINNNTNGNIESVAAASSYSYINPALITADNVNMRRTASLSGTVLYQLNKSTSIHVDEAKAVYADGIWWFPCKYKNTYGFVAAKYVKVIPT